MPKLNGQEISADLYRELSSNPTALANYGGGALTADAGPGGAAGGMDPGSLAALFRPPPVTLPGAEAAKTGLRDLQTTATGGLKSLIGQDPSARREAVRKAMFDKTASDINYSSDRLARDAKEGQNAKNFLTSSATGDYFLDPIERNRSVGLEKADQDAIINSGNEVRADAASQAQTIGQAFNSASAGLQGEATVENANAQRAQQGNEAGYQLGSQLSEAEKNRTQQNTQFGRSLDQTKELQNAAFQNARDISSSNALAGGVGAGIGGLAQLFAPTANAALQRFF